MKHGEEGTHYTCMEHSDGSKGCCACNPNPADCFWGESHELPKPNTSPQEKPWWEDLSQWDPQGSSTGIEYKIALEMETKRCLHKVSHIIERLISEAEERAVKRERERCMKIVKQAIENNNTFGYQNPSAEQDLEDVLYKLTPKDKTSV